ncbi:MAG: hypothetical protein GQ557_01405 [Mycoplasmataceae bacterium]|nr:hypothetical protein [Mycoplasmataceae bacterium]
MAYTKQKENFEDTMKIIDSIKSSDDLLSYIDIVKKTKLLLPRVKYLMKMNKDCFHMKEKRGKFRYWTLTKAGCEFTSDGVIEDTSDLFDMLVFFYTKCTERRAFVYWCYEKINNKTR